MYNYKLFEDNAGGYNLAVLNDSDACIYYFADGGDHAIMIETLSDLIAGGDPIADYWEGGEDDPDACYKQISAWVDERNGGAWELDSDEIAALLAQTKQ